MELNEIRGIGVKTLELLNKENINTVYDLVTYFPRSYSIFEVDNSKVYSSLYTCIKGVVCANPFFIKYRRNVNAVIFYLLIDDKKVKCILYASDYLRYKLFKGVSVVLYGRYKSINKEFVGQNIFFDEFKINIETNYHLKNISDSVMKRAVKNCLLAGESFSDFLPAELINKYKLISFNDLILKSHFPENKDDYIQIQRRRKYEEFFWYSVSLEVLKITRRDLIKEKRNIDDKVIDTFISNLPYKLTSDQEKTIEVVKNDILNGYPMNRLVQGDVGSGKSIVAYISALMLMSCGFQAAIMVPTEILAKQQYDIAYSLFSSMGYIVELLTSSTKSKEKDDILYRLHNNRVNLIIGTHALIEDNVKFYRLGLIVIDEQHRFGVMQRKKLISKYNNVDCLYLSATPIPRTLGLSAFGDLDISSIHTKPSNRKKITTKLFNYDSLDKISASIKKHVLKGEQAYIVVPLVIENENIDAMDINSAYEYFSKSLKEISIGVVHGKMKSAEKNKVMNDFKSGRLSVLISTTVIEVGVDVSKASVMVILDANRYGLAQIHQLRGRVGRGSIESFCILVSRVDNERLKLLETLDDGFEISEADLKLRGPGDFLGDDQSGFLGLDYADFQADFKIWSYAKEDGSIYAHKFLETKSKNKKFREILSTNNQQKGKIN